jgi:RNA polymerase sigma factor (sigma-70 family)
MKVSDDILIQKTLDGDKSSFGILVDRYKLSVFQHVIKTTRNFHEAEDITQDAFLEAYLNLQKLREPEKFGGWLWGITQNFCQRWLRKKRMLADLEIPLDNLQTEVLNQWLNEQENSESWEFGTDVANKLSDDQKSLLKLFYIDDCSCRDIAQQMGVTEVAIRQRLSRTRQQLKNDLLEGENMNEMIAISAICAFLLGSALSVSAETWRDDFENGVLDGWTKFEWPGQNTGNIEERDGVMVITDTDGLYDTAAIFNSGQHIKDFTLTVDVKIAKAEENNSYMQILFRAVYGGENGTIAYNNYPVNGKASIAIFNMAPGRVQPDIGKVWVPFVIEIGKWYHIKLEMKGTQVKLWIDGQLMQQVDWKGQSLLPEAGEINLSGGGGEFHWDNFIITGDEILPVQPKSKLPTTWGNIKSR